MRGKMGRSTSRPPFGHPHSIVFSPTLALGLQGGRKSASIHSVRGSFGRSPDYNGTTKMVAYFLGEKKYGPFEIREGSNLLAYYITEQWINTDRSHTVCCGIDSHMGDNVTIGVSRSELNGFESFIEGSLGPSGIASIKSNIRTNTQFTTAFNESASVGDTFDYPAPACGSYTYTLHQLARDYKFVIHTDRLFRKPLINTYPPVRELTRNFACRRASDPQFPDCPCGSAHENEGEEIASLSFRDFSLTLDAKRKSSSDVSFTIGKRTYSVELSVDSRDRSEVVIYDLPKMFRVLSGIRDDKVTASVELEKEFELTDLKILEEEIAATAAA